MWLHRVDVGHVTDTSELHAASIFRDKMRSVGVQLSRCSVPIGSDRGANSYYPPPLNFWKYKPIYTQKLIHPTRFDPEYGDSMYPQNVGTSTRYKNPRTKLTSNHFKSVLFFLYFFFFFLETLTD
jgi:hypothetical protein